MLSTPFSRLNISCTCLECTTFLRPYPTNSTNSTTRLPLRFPPGLLPPDLSFTPLPTAPTTPTLTPRLTPQLSRTAPVLAPSPNFLPTGASPSKRKPRSRPLPPSITLSPTWHTKDAAVKKVTLASRSLWTRISSPIGEPLTSAKTPGLAPCANNACAGKLVPRFGRALCNICVGELRVSIDSMLVDRPSARPDRTASSLAADAKHASKHADAQTTHPALSPVPSTPPSTKLQIIHSLAARDTTHADQHLRTNREPDSTPSRYAMDFPALPGSRGDGAEVSELADVSKLTQDNQKNTTDGQASPSTASKKSPFSFSHVEFFGAVDFGRKLDWGADWSGRLMDGEGWAACSNLTKVLRDGM